MSVLYQSLRDFSFPLGSDISYSQISPVSVFFFRETEICLCSVIKFFVLWTTSLPECYYSGQWCRLCVGLVLDTRPSDPVFSHAVRCSPSSELNLKVQFVPQRERGPCPLWTPVRKCWMGNRSLCVMRTIRNTPYVKIQGLIKLPQFVPLRFKRITTSIIRKDVISGSSSSS